MEPSRGLAGHGDKHAEHAVHHHVDAHLVHWSTTFLDERAAAHARAQAATVPDEEGSKINNAQDARDSEDTSFDADAATAAVTAVLSSPVRGHDLVACNTRAGNLLLAHSPEAHHVPAAQRPYKSDFPATFTPAWLDGSTADLPQTSEARVLPPQDWSWKSPEEQLEEDMLTLALRPAPERTPELPPWTGARAAQPSKRLPKLNDKGQSIFRV